jgi:hypothetical protein
MLHAACAYAYARRVNKEPGRERSQDVDSAFLGQLSDANVLEIAMEGREKGEMEWELGVMHDMTQGGVKKKEWLKCIVSTLKYLAIDF